MEQSVSKREQATKNLRRSALAHNLAATFVIAIWLRLNATRAQLSALRFTGRAGFTPWPRWADPAHKTFDRKDAQYYVRARMLACVAGPAAETLHTGWPADTAASEAEALAFAARIGAQDKAQRWLKRAQQGAGRWPVIRTSGPL